MSLTEFLLARIAEDEARASGRSPEPHGNDCDVVSDYLDGAVTCTCDYPLKMLGECEAKRRIVQRHDEPGWPGCGTLRALALPYADHPHYKQEWAL